MAAAAETSDPASRARGRRRVLLIFAAFVLLAYCGQAGYTLAQARRSAIAAAETNARNLAHTLEEHALHTVLGLKLILAGYSQFALFDESLLARGNARAVALLRQRADMLPQVRGMLLLGPDGRTLLDAASPTPEIRDLSDRDYFRIHRDDPASGFFIGKPVQGRATGKWFIPATMPIRRDGRLLAVLNAIVEPAYFSAFYKSLDVGANGLVGLFNADGTLLVRAPEEGAEIGRSYADRQPFSGAPMGHFHGPGPKGEPMIVAYRRMAEVPLVVVVALDRSEVLAPWRREVAQFATIGAVIGAVLAGLLITLNRQMGLRERSEGRLRDAIESVSEGFALFGPDERLILCNDRYRAMYETPELRLVPGTQFRALVAAAAAAGRIAPQAAPEADGRPARPGRPGGSFEVPLSDGRFVLISEHATREGGTVSVHTDVTALRSRETEAMQARLRAEESDRAKTEFVANMSHELRTPLNAIIGFSEIMEQRLFGPLGNARYEEYARLIGRGGRYLLAIINDILDFAKISAGRMELDEGTVSLAAVVEACEVMMADRLRFGGLAYTSHLPPALPPLRADETKLKQALLNLLSNAAKFTESGGRVTLTATLHPDGALALTVADTGIGMTEDELRIALTPFRQVDGTLARRRDGTGLGLPLARAFVALHGGELLIESARGQGTRATILLPAERVMAEAMAVA
ncbi:MAG TPA: ATP-binding protein [Alphaproteobacteria bacterium]|nr:ATP-binding protein [Alphaproteobacteria bacterium]